VTRSIAYIVALALALIGSHVAAGQPSDPPPKVAGVANPPPPAWVDLGSRDRWLAYSSFCWTTACVDFIPPARRPDLPVLSSTHGSRLRFHLGFLPRSTSLALVDANGTRRRWLLARARTPAWRAVTTGVLILEARSARGSASYAFRLRLG
jgi:hypothetical protein